MKRSDLINKLPLFAAAIGFLLAAGWIALPPQMPHVILRQPGADRQGILPSREQPIDLQGVLIAGPGRPADLTASWPGFRGLARDNISDIPGPARQIWPKTPPRHLWQIDTGEGYAGPAINAGRVYLLDYDQKTQSDVLRCVSLSDGAEIWDRSYHIEVKRNHGMSRTVPAVTGRFVVTLGPKCQVSCADAITGEFRWGIDLVAAYKTTVPQWYAGQCPLIDGDRVLLAPGGDALMIAVDLASGQVLWKAPNPHHWAMTHSSIMTMLLSGRKTYVYCASGGVAGISAADGTILWETNQWKVSIATVPSPLILDDQRIFLCGGYNAGAMLLRLANNAGPIVPEVAYKLPAEVFGGGQHTPILYQGHIYGVIPGGRLVCLDVDTGKQLWNSGQDKFGLGPFLIRNGQIFVMNDEGVLTIARATPERYDRLAQWTVIDDAVECWGPTALAGDRLLVRDLRRMVCLDLREAGHE